MAVIEVVTEKVSSKAPASAADAKAQINTATEAADAKEPEVKEVAPEKTEGDAAIEHNTLAENAAADAPVAVEQDAVEAEEKTQA